MKFTCNQQILAKAMNTVSKAVTARTTVPVLKGILLQANENNELTMTASDLDISIEKKVDVITEQPGSIVVMAKLFGDIIRKLPDEVVTFEVEEEGNINIKTSYSEFNIMGIPADEFPGTENDLEEADEFSFSSEMLKEMIRKIHFCASMDETKGIITGILTEIEPGCINMAALDGFRMAVAREKINNDKEKRIVIAARMMNELSKIISDEEDEFVNIRISDKKAQVVMNSTKVTMRLMDGEYLDYRRIMKNDVNATIVINNKELLSSIERASLLAREGKNNLVRLKTQENLLRITSNSEEGKVKEEIIIDKEGTDIEIGFNSKYVSDALKAIDDEEIVMELNTPTTPCLLKPLEGDSFEYVILPVRIPASL